MRYRYAFDYDEAVVAELYDRRETYTDDVELIRRLIEGRGALNILECFCGTGRIALPLIQDGHQVTGIDIAEAMLARARDKSGALSAEAARRARWVCGDVLGGGWGSGYDMIILGGNAFYELPSAAMQQRCITLAAESASPGGFLYVDNNDFGGNWQLAPQPRVVFEGTTADGSIVRYVMEELSFDERAAVLQMRRTLEIVRIDGSEHRAEYLSAKHPVSKAEVQQWLEAARWEILETFGDRRSTPYGAGGNRAIFWARRPAT